MKIVVDHLTRMQPGYICAAGIDISNAQHIRPVLSGRLTTDLLVANGGPFGIASLVDLGEVHYCGCAPSIEDYSFRLSNARSMRVLPPEEFWKLLQQVARKSIVEIFGTEIKSLRRGCVVDVETGEASLGCLIPAEPPHLYVDDYSKTRARITDEVFRVNLSVTDIRLYEADQKTPKENLIKQVDRQMQAGASVILSVGLSRPWKQADDTVERHWLQLNNIHFRGRAG